MRKKVRKKKPFVSRPVIIALPWVITVAVLALWVFLAVRAYQTTSDELQTSRTPNTNVQITERDAPSTNTSKKAYTLPSSENKEPSLLFVGDTMLGRYVETLMRKSGDTYPFEKAVEILDSHDAVVGNLEGPIDTTHTQTPDDSLVFSFLPSVAPALKAAGFSHLGIANNHGRDQGAAGVRDTRDALTAAGITPFGDPQSVSQDYVAQTTIRGRTIVLLGVHAVSSSYQPLETVALIERLRVDHPDAFMIVFPHWGSEYQTHSSSRQQALGHLFVDAGADAVLGHHPHVVQEAEVYKDRLIVYSLGNFIFDQYFSEETEQALAVELTLSAAAVTYRFHPLHSTKSQPMPLNGAERKTWLAAYADQSNILSLATGTLELAREPRAE
jgi:poly-gamma-glutamate synthesis protein (capsule biosynthesis protein)